MSDVSIDSEPARRSVTDYLDKYTRQSAEVAQDSFAVFRRAVHPDIKWGHFVARLTRELQRFGEALEAGGGRSWQYLLLRKWGSHWRPKTSQLGFLGAILISKQFMRHTVKTLALE
jgi:hypothetical protein